MRPQGHHHHDQTYDVLVVVLRLLEVRGVHVVGRLAAAAARSAPVDAAPAAGRLLTVRGGGGEEEGRGGRLRVKSSFCYSFKHHSMIHQEQIAVATCVHHYFINHFFSECSSNNHFYLVDIVDGLLVLVLHHDGRDEKVARDRSLAEVRALAIGKGHELVAAGEAWHRHAPQRPVVLHEGCFVVATGRDLAVGSAAVHAEVAAAARALLDRVERLLLAVDDVKLVVRRAAACFVGAAAAGALLVEHQFFYPERLEEVPVDRLAFRRLERDVAGLRHGSASNTRGGATAKAKGHYWRIAFNAFEQEKIEAKT